MTYKIRWPAIDAPFYMTFNYYEEDGQKYPLPFLACTLNVHHLRPILLT